MATAVMRLSAFLGLAALVAGCGRGAAPPTASETVTSTVTATQTNSADINNNGTPDSDVADQDWPGRMVPVYEPARTPEAIAGKEFMQQNSMAEQFADDLTATLRLPFDIPVKGVQCDEENLYWDSGEKSINLCYEDVARLINEAGDLGDSDPTDATFNTMLLGYYHESGHMVIDLYKLPVTGREEDDADQVSAYLMLRPNPDGTVDRDALDAIGQAARSFGADSRDVDDSVLSDVHSPSRARMYNLECWTYGADPKYGEDLVADGLLPQDRADGCEDEYAKLRDSWDRLLEPYFK